MKSALRALLGFLALTQPALALEFASTGRPAILYDGPSTAAEKVAIASAGYPLEKIVTTAGWVKVRDETGSLLWVDASALSDKRTVLVNAPVAQVFEQAAENAQPRFRAARGVIFEVLSLEPGGWIRVRHASGGEGYLRVPDVWGI